MEPYADQPNKTQSSSHDSLTGSTNISQQADVTVSSKGFSNISKACPTVSLAYTETFSMSKPSLCKKDTKNQDQCHEESEADRLISEEDTSTGNGSNCDEEEDNYVNSGRERLKRHRSEVAGRVWIPEKWGQEELLKDWIDCSAFDASLAPTTQRIMSARNALVQQHMNTSSSPISPNRIRVVNRC